MTEPASRLAVRLAGEWKAGRPLSVTWLNHFTAMQALRSERVDLGGFDYVGVDGLLLLRLLGSGTQERTSADLVVPHLLPLLARARVALVGGARHAAERAAEALDRCWLARSGGTVVDVRDGYEQLPNQTDIDQWLRGCQPDVILVGLGAVRQESWALAVRKQLSSGLVMTCGGFFDQVGTERPYYPAWAYPLRLNWAVRVAREPRRLWRRYTVEAVEALAAQQSLRYEILGLPGFAAHRTALGLSGRTAVRSEEARNRVTPVVPSLSWRASPGN